MKSLSFVTAQPSTISAAGAATASVDATPTVGAKGTTPGECLNTFIAGKYSPFKMWISESTEGPFKGRKVLKVPAEDILSKEAGRLRVTINWPTERNGGLFVKVCLSGIVEKNELIVLSAGGGALDNDDKPDWRSIQTAELPLSALFEAGYFEPVAQGRIVAWCAANCGKEDIKGLPLHIKSTLFMVLYATKVPVKPRQTGGRSIVTPHKPGDYCGVGCDVLGFKGASLLPFKSQLMYAGDEPVLPESLAAMVAKYCASAKPVTMQEADDDLI